MVDAARKLLIHVCLATYWFTSIPVLRKLWWILYDVIKANSSGSVKLKLHGYQAIQPKAYTYPYNARLYKTLNNPLIECVYQAQRHSKFVTVMDVGAAIGDTVFLLKANCPQMVEHYYCVDGDEEFFGYLKANMAGFSDVTLIQSLISDKSETVAGLVRIHEGTASSQGQTKHQASTLDRIVDSYDITSVSVLKIDVDGYDGRVIAGAISTLRDFKPIVIFEWHPKLYLATSNAHKQPFEVLTENGYDRFIWFRNTGEVNHLSCKFDALYLDLLFSTCINSSTDSDKHYDVVALHESCKSSVEDFFNSDYSRNKKSRF